MAIKRACMCMYEQVAVSPVKPSLSYRERCLILRHSVFLLRNVHAKTTAGTDPSHAASPAAVPDKTSQCTPTRTHTSLFTLALFVVGISKAELT